MTEKNKPPVSEIFEQAMKNYEQTLRSGLKLQEETGKMLTSLFYETASPHDIQKQFTTEVLPAAQKRFGECVALFEQNSRIGFDLLKKGLEAGQITSVADKQAKYVDLCEASLKTLRSNAQAVSDINAKAIDSYVEFVKKATAEVSGTKATKA